MSLPAGGRLRRRVRRIATSGPKANPYPR